MPTIEALIFDFDGVLADSLKAHTEARLEAFDELGYKVSQSLHDEAHSHGSHPPEIIGWILKEAKIVPPNADVLKNRKVQEVVSLKKDIFRSRATEGLDAIPGSVEFIGRAVRKFGAKRLAIATTASREDEVLPYLRRHDLEGSLSVVAAQEDTPLDAMKPHPFVYQKALQGLGYATKAAKAGVIEDSPRGIEAARAAGTYVFGLATTHRIEDLSGANRIVGSFVALDYLVEQ